MMDSPIPPLPFPPAPHGPGERRFRLPLALRLRLPAEGLACVLVARGGERPAELTVRGPADAALLRVTLAPGVPAVVLLPGDTRLLALAAPDAPAALTLGYYPLHKVGLKLHAFAAGAFPGASALARWKEAGTAARTLRGALNALVEASDAAAVREAALYRRYRARFVEDFTGVPGPDAAPRLAFLSALGAQPPDALVPCARALAGQTDDGFEWLVAVSPRRLAAEGAALAAALGAKARLIACDDPRLGARLAAALAASDAGLVCPLDPARRPTRDAVAMLRDAFAGAPDCRLLYTDEEHLDASGGPVAGVFKPAFNAHLLQASFYLGGLIALPRADAARLGFDPDAGTACIYDLVLRHTAGLPSSAIRHLPRVACGSATAAPGFAADEIADAAAVLGRATGVAVARVAGGRPDRWHLRPLFPVPPFEPLVSIVVPTRDRAGLLGMALRSLIAHTTYRRFEIVIVDNGSVEAETFALFAEIAAAWPATKVVRDDGDFNFPRICNAGVAAARGELVLLLNNDIEVVDGGWLSEMVALAARPGTGIVGARLLYPDRTVQHSGAIVGLFRYADHWFAHSVADAPGYQDRLLVRQNLTAVTAACLLIRRSVWEEIGPLDAVRFAEDCNDIDLCLRARRAGYAVVFTPFTGLIHHESASRGKKRSKAHRQRLKAQRARMEEAWHTSRFVDPHYNPNLARRSLFAALADAPEGARTPRTDGV